MPRLAELYFREKLVENLRSRAQEVKKPRMAVVKVRPQAVIVEERQREITRSVEELRERYAKILND
ncbi:hypothetical protein [Priestia megaterium]|uniref:hypothetical protein n=1 Tax=Priestia megaterium TaxID=1404 RepID=UPI00203D0CBA|nr:hypothetical protein [Priestia megaterium]MCM3099913.1 hypothetical protein [Priestia megaterium]